jgi:hypothetical protein
MEIKENIFWQWISWQFFDVPKNILKAWKNFLDFGLYYFSIPLLIKTLFSPWRRYKWSYGKGFDIGKYFEAFFSNLIFRILGAILRCFLIIIGILFEIFIIFAGAIVFFGWLILPALLIAGLIFGFKIII